MLPDFRVGFTRLCTNARSGQSCLPLCDPMDCGPPAPLSIGFCRQESWSVLPCPPLGDLPDPSLMSPTLAAWDFPGSSVGEESSCNAGDLASIPGLGRSPWRKAWQPTPVFLPGESYEQRNLVGYSPWGCRVHRTELLSLLILFTTSHLWSPCTLFY